MHGDDRDTLPFSGHALLVGSGRSAVDVLNYDTRHALVAVINNAHRLRSDWDIAFVPGNFAGTRPLPNRDQITTVRL